MNPHSFKKKLEKAAILDHPYVERLSLPSVPPSQARRASVLVLFGSPLADPSPHILVIRRSKNLESHPGEMAFPGGILEMNESPELGALRETNEEVGISLQEIEFLFELPWLRTLSSEIWIRPVVGFLNVPMDEMNLKLEPKEIAAAYWLNLKTLQDPEIHLESTYHWQGMSLPIHQFLVPPGEKIWGATAAILKNLLERLERV